MRYQLSNKKFINIPDAEIEKNMKILKISKDEAVKMYLEDEGYEVNEEQTALEQKAKENRITATIHGAKAEYTKKTQRERVVKEDKPKEDLIKAISALLRGTEGITEVEIANVAKLITFKLGGEHYTVNLIRNTKKNKAEKGEG